MSKKLYFLICAVFVLAFARGAAAQERSFWSDLNGTDHLWSTPDNWWTLVWSDPNWVKAGANTVPDADVNTGVYIGKGEAHVDYPPELYDLVVTYGQQRIDPTIDSTVTAEANYVLCGGGYNLGQSSPDPCLHHYLTVTGGSLTISTPVLGDWYREYNVYNEFLGQWMPGRICIGSVGNVIGTGYSSGTMNVSGGTVNAGGHMEVGTWENAYGELNMTGGTINLTQGLYCPASYWGATGKVNLLGGTINAGYFESLPGGSTGVLDVSGGKMVLSAGDETGLISGYVDEGRVTVYGVGHGELVTDPCYGAAVGKRVALSMDYDVSNEGKTTITAPLSDPCQAWNPSPADDALNVKGPPSDLQRPVLSWSAGDNAGTHDVYFGTSFDEVNDADTSAGAFVHTQAVADVNWTVDTDLAALGQYYWRIDEVNATTIKGDVWDFTIGNLAKASYPNPVDNATGVSTDVILGWTAGIYTDSHDVYFGTSFDDVNEATTSVDPNGVFQGNQAGTSFDVKNYDANALEFSTTYYWRIDDVNLPSTYRGDVWSFTTAAHLTVDDFDSYVSDAELYAVWSDYWTQDPHSGAEIFLEKSPGITRIDSTGEDSNSIKFLYLNEYTSGGKQLGSFTDADIADLAIGPDWTVSGARALVLYFYGSSGNSATENDKMWFELEDTSSNTGVAVYDGDPNDVKEAEWHEWNIDLSLFDACGVSLQNVDKVHFGFGNYYRTGQAKAGGSGTVYFDDIQVWPQRCVPKYASIADFSDNCIVDGYDLEVMSEDWLMRDYNTLGYTGTLKNFPPLGDPNYDNCWISGPNGGALYLNADNPDPCDPFPPGDDYVEIPPLNLNSNTVSFTLWAKSMGLQRDDGGLFFCSYRDDGPGTTESGFVLGLTQTNSLNYNWQNAVKTYGWDPDPVMVLPTNQWAFCALTVAPSTARIYMKKLSEPVADPVTYATNTDATHAAEAFDCPSRIGDHKNRRFVGAIDDFRIYNKTLSYDEVRWLATDGAYGTDPADANLYAHYLLDDGSGLTALDDAGSALNYWPVPSVANIAGDDVEAEYHRFVNMRDFGRLADDWLIDMPWPRP
jgi:hypothetical protein